MPYEVYTFGELMTEKVNFTIKLAEVPIGVSAIFPTTKRYCSDYITYDPPAILIDLTEDDIEFERKKAKELDEYENTSSRSYFSKAYLEVVALHRKVSDFVLNHDIIMFHGSAISLDGECYIFTAKSGTGKSTHTRLWREMFGDRAVMVNDDKPFIKITDTGATVYGTPWNGKHMLGENVSAPLKAICLLGRDSYNHIEPITGSEALPVLLEQTYRRRDQQELLKVAVLLSKLTKNVKFYRLGCNMDPSAAAVSYEGMK